MAADLEIIVERKLLPDGEPLFCDLRLQIAAGECVGLIGPSGVGKSSLLRLLAGLDRSYAGSRTVHAPDAGALAVGVVFQEPRLVPWLTILGNLRLVQPGLSSADAAVQLEALGVAGCADLYPHQLSLGMQRRVALARAMIVQPSALLLDEPFASLDHETSIRVQKLLARAAAARKTTMVIASHDLEEVARLADRIVTLTGRPARLRELSPVTTHRGARGEAEVAILARSLHEQMHTDV